MPRLIGTPGDDQLIAPNEDGWVIRGRRGDDYLEGGDGVDRLYGDAGNDQIQGWGGNDSLYGGSGDDLLSGGREAWGGTGNDVIDAWELAVGGSGNDLIYGVYALHGDEAPGREHRVAGNDELHAIGAAPAATMNGGLGADRFYADGAQGDGVGEIIVIEDFESGVDKIWAARYGAGDDGSSAALFDRLDADKNGVLNLWDSYAGGAVYVRADGSMRLGISWTFATATGHDIEDSIVVHGATGSQITMADFIF